MDDDVYMASDDTRPALPTERQADLSDAEVFMAGDASGAPHATTQTGGGDGTPPGVLDTLDGEEAPDATPTTRRDRLRTITRQGGFTKVPVSYKQGDDWQTVRSDDPFERLYLDWASASHVSDELVRSHGSILRDFWADRVATYDDGAGSPANRDRMLRDFGGGRLSVFRALPDDVSHAADALRTPADRIRVAERIRSDVQEAVRIEVLKARDDHRVAPEEARQILALAETRGYTPDEAAALILTLLNESGYRPEREPSGTAPADRLLSTAWIDGSTSQDLSPAQRAFLKRFASEKLHDGELKPDETRTYFDQARAQHIPEELATNFLHEALQIDAGKYVPAPGTSPTGEGTNLLASVRWLRKDHPEVRAWRQQQREGQGKQKPGRKPSRTEALPVAPVPTKPAVATASSPSKPHSTPSVALARPARKRSPFLWVFLAVVGAVVFVLVNRPSDRDPDPPPRVRVATARLNVRSDHSARGTDIIGYLSQGDHVAFTDVYVDCARNALWVQVTNPAGGWVSAEFLEGLPWTSAAEHPTCQPASATAATDPLPPTIPDPEPTHDPVPPQPNAVDPARVYEASEVDRPARVAGTSPVTTETVSQPRRVRFDVAVGADGALIRSDCADAPVFCDAALAGFNSARLIPGRLQGQAVMSRTSVTISLVPPRQSRIGSGDAPGEQRPAPPAPASLPPSSSCAFDVAALDRQIGRQEARCPTLESDPKLHTQCLAELERIRGLRASCN